LPDKFQVQLSFEPMDAANDDRPLMRLVEIAQRYPVNPDAPMDLAAQHDHYLYGTPKRP